MRASELTAARKRLGLTKTEFARAVNSWWATKNGSPAKYAQERISHFESGKLGIPIKIMWFIDELDPSPN